MWLQIILPVIVAVGLCVAAAAVIGLTTMRGEGDVARWSAISTIWLSLPLVLGGGLLLMVLLLAIYAAARMINLVPPYSWKLQRIAFRVESGSRRGAEMVRKPLLALRAIGSMVGRRLPRTRERT
jgi:hypothetical protein